MRKVFTGLSVGMLLLSFSGYGVNANEVKVDVSQSIKGNSTVSVSSKTQINTESTTSGEKTRTKK